jgi:hypothetical protein
MVPALSKEQDEQVKSIIEEVVPMVPTWLSVSRIDPGAPFRLDSMKTVTGLIPGVPGRVRIARMVSVRVALSVGVKGLAINWFKPGTVPIT